MRKLILSTIEAADSAQLEVDRLLLNSDRFNADELLRLRHHSVRLRTLTADLKLELYKLDGAQQEASPVKEAVRPAPEIQVAEVLKAFENFFKMFK